MKIAAVLSVVLFGGSTAIAANAPRILPPHASVYLVPTDASARLAHFIRHPAMFDRRLKHADLRIVPTLSQSQYSILCEPPADKHHNSAFTHFIGGYVPASATMLVRVSETGKIVDAIQFDATTGPRKRVVDFTARICAAKLPLSPQ